LKPEEISIGEKKIPKKPAGDSALVAALREKEKDGCRERGCSRKPAKRERQKK